MESIIAMAKGWEIGMEPMMAFYGILGLMINTNP
mgnify:CR=1 FL=1